MTIWQIFSVWIVSSLVLYLTATIIPGFKIKSFGRAMVASAIVGFFNATLWYLLFFLTLPINIITLGLFTFVVNAMVLRFSASLLKGFDIKGWWPAIIGAIFIALVNALLRDFGFL